MDDGQFARWKRSVPDRRGDAGLLTEEREAFSLRVLLEEETGKLRVAVFHVPKQDWSSWWDRVSGEFDESVVRAVAGEGVVTLNPAVGVDAGNGGGRDGWFETGGGQQTEGSSSAGGTWRRGPAVDEPEARRRHTAVWTGSLMLIWGGEIPGDIDNLRAGDRYDPATDTWWPISLENAPSARVDHTAVWTDSVMIVWGGIVRGTALDTGGRYDPVTDRWEPTSTEGAPDGRWFIRQSGRAAPWLSGGVVRRMGPR